MAERRNITNAGVTNTGVFIGGDNTNSAITVGRTGAAGGLDEAAMLRKLDTLFTELLGDIGQLPAELAGTAAYQTVQLKTELAAPDRDPKRIHAVLSGLKTAVTTAAPLVEIVQDIADLVSHLVH